MAADYVASSFEETGRHVGVALEPLVTTAAGHPQRPAPPSYRERAERAP